MIDTIQCNVAIAVTVVHLVCHEAEYSWEKLDSRNSLFYSYFLTAVLVAGGARAVCV